MTIYGYSIGTTYGSMSNVESFAGTALPAPKGEFIPYSQPMDLGDGTQRGGGWAVARWHWDFLTQAQRDMLKTFCPGKSSNVYITTRKQDLTYDTYTAVMVWVDEEQRDAGRAIDITVEFRKLVEYNT